jgi:hypothetical protein
MSVAISCIVNHLKPRLVKIILKNAVRTSKRTSHFTVAKIKRLTLFKEIIAVYSENHTKPINNKYKSCLMLKGLVHIATIRL